MDFEQKLGYRFKDRKYLEQALSHSSYANENKHERQSNERLEFLGDSVLSLIVSQYLFTNFTHLPEGELSKVRASLVCEKSLCGFAKQIGLGDCIRLGKGEELTGGRTRPSILADAFEAVIAAIFLDGGMEQARAFVLRFIPDETIEEVRKGHTIVFNDYKTLLQEIVQMNPEERVEYVLAGESGPDHDKSFEVTVCLNSNVIGRGRGKSKKQAEQEAAREALELMGYSVHGQG